MAGELTSREWSLDMGSPEIQELLRAQARPRGTRGWSVLKVMNAAGRSGWSNHDILAIGSELSCRWGVSDPGENLFRHWNQLLNSLGNVRRHYPDTLRQTEAMRSPAGGE